MQKMSATDSQRRSFPCDECDKTYSSKWKLKTHKIKVHHQGVAPTCTICSQEFSSTNTALKRHLQEIHQNVKRFNCAVCDYQAFRPNQLAEHNRKVHGHSKLVCKNCNKEFNILRCLKNHQKVCGVNVIQQHKCTSCDKSYASKRALWYHIKVHHSESNDFICEICGKNYKRKYSYTRHVNGAHKNE